MATKGHLIQSAYAQIRISGLTVQPTPEAGEFALVMLETMMAEYEGRGIDVGYNFEDQPDPDSESGIVAADVNMAVMNLAVRMIPAYNKEVPVILMALAKGSLSNTSARIGRDRIRKTAHPSRMPRGSGESLRFNRWSHYFPQDQEAPASSSTNKLVIGDVNDYEESFHAYLAGERIASFVISATNGLTLASSSSTDDVVNYRVTAEDATQVGKQQQVKISVTTNTGRVDTRIIDFSTMTNRI